MFTWICPQCGREVPPSDNECPDCANRKVTRERQPSPVRGSTGALKPAPPTRARGHLPGWLLSVIFAVVFVGLGGAAYFGYRHLRGGKQPADAVDLESPAGAATDPTPAPKAPSIVDRYVEVAGLRPLDVVADTPMEDLAETECALVEIRQRVERAQLARFGPLSISHVQHGQAITLCGNRGCDATVHAATGQDHG